jgi:hypothetical protein
MPLSLPSRSPVPDFEGTQQELEELLLEGLNSGDPVEADQAFWNRLTAETDKMASTHVKPKTW